MEKKILVAIDNSVQAVETIDYAAEIYKTIAPARFTLLHIQPVLSQYLTDEAQHKQSAQQALKKVMAENKNKAQETLEKASRRMIGKGMDDSLVERMTLPRNIAIADDILALGTAKSFDAILVGRKGASYLRQWFMGSVTANIVEHSAVTPIWLVDGTVPSAGKVLLAADGSRATLRALDHLAYMLSDHPEATVHMLHIRPRLQDFCEIVVEDEQRQSAEALLYNDDQGCMDDFYHQAITIAKRNGLTEDRMKIVTLDGKLSITGSILRYAGDNGFGTVVFGRSGQSKSAFFGSVSRGILQKAESLALWVVP
jgi:nucleotide-binding universal stress UspA family protein